MNDVAMIMAGGMGARMEQSGITLPKPLVCVAGKPLLERNVDRLLALGFRDIIIVTPGSNLPVNDFAETVLQPKTRAAGARLFIHREARPLGNIGAVEIARKWNNVVIVYADNISTLDIRDLCAFHDEGKWDMSIAVHRHPVTIPYGEVMMEGDIVTDYREKPTIQIDVCSAFCVVGARARSLIRPDEALGLSAFVMRLAGNGLKVGAFRHSAPWIDVNDAAQLPLAQALIADHPDVFPGP